MKKQKKAVRVNPLVLATRMQLAHRDTYVIEKERQLAQFKLAQCEDSIIALQSTLDRKRAERRDINAVLEGIALVVERR